MEKQSYTDFFNHTRQMMGALGKEMPKTMSPFFQMHKESLAPGALDTKTKELIALAISVRIQCETCMTFHLHDAIEAGATREEIQDALGVAVLMGGAPSVAQAIRVLEAANEFGP
jgi:AhpD family alkylhydroperoxidase